MKIAALILLLLAPAISCAQTRIDTIYRVELTATASPIVSFFRHPSVPGTNDKTCLGGGIFLRGMWHPGRLLSVGFITGYMLIDQDEIPAGNLMYRARLTAIPMQLAISMRKHNVEVGCGVGPYMMLTSIEGGNSAPAHGSRLELGLTFLGSYSFALNDYIKIAPEMRVLYLRYRGILSLMPSCSVRLDAVRY
jgi:hypothetical protein